MSKRIPIPREARIYVELGTKRPSESGFDALLPFKMLWVVTNGAIRKNFLWITMRKTGLYVAFGGPGHAHTSYHTDGKFHSKFKRHTVELGQRQPLRELGKPELVQSGGVTITDEALDSYELTSFADKPVDRVVYLDNRVLPEWIDYQMWAVPPFNHGRVALMTDLPAQIHIVTHTNPWIEVIIYEHRKT